MRLTAGVALVLFLVGCGEDEALEGAWVLAQGTQSFEPEVLCGPTIEISPGRVELLVSTDGNTGTVEIGYCLWNLTGDNSRMSAPAPQECEEPQAIVTLSSLTLEIEGQQLHLLREQNITLQSGISCNSFDDFVFIRELTE